MKRVGICFLALLVLASCKTKPEAPTERELTPIEHIQEVAGLSKVESESLYSIVEDCGILFEKIYADEKLNNYKDSGGKGYWITTPNVNEVVVYMTPENSVLEIRYRNEYLYRDGKTEKLLYDAVSEGYITLREYEQIEMGMTYSKVKTIVGGGGTQISKTDLGIGKEYVTVTYSWEGFNGYGSNAIIMFQGGKVVSMSQIGLE